MTEQKYTDYRILYGFDYDEHKKFTKLVNSYLANGYTIYNSHINGTHFIEVVLVNPEYKDDKKKQSEYIQIKKSKLMENIEDIQKEVMSYIKKGYVLFKSHMEETRNPTLTIELVLLS